MTEPVPEPSAAAARDPSTSLRKQLRAVRSWLPALLLSASFAAGGAFYVTSQQQPVYEAQATLVVGQSLSAADPDLDRLLVSQRLSTMYATLATTRPLLEKVRADLGLTESTDQLARRVRAAAAPDSTLLAITAQDTDPDRGAAVANAVAGRLVADSPAVEGPAADMKRAIDEDISATRREIATARAEMEGLLALPARTPVQEQRLETVQERLVTLRSLQADLLPFSSEHASGLVTVLQPAVPGAAPVSPRPLLSAQLGAVLGLFITAALLFVMRRLDDRIHDAEDLEEVVGLPTLGSIARLGGRAAAGDDRLVTLREPRSSAAEAYRSLRTRISFATADAPLRTLLIISSTRGEGRTTTAANLAVVFATAGRRVLLVDADLRHPTVHALFDIPNGPGLSSVALVDDPALTAIVHPTRLERLSVMTAGASPLDAAALLDSVRMREVVSRVRAAYDLVIFDSPPLTLAADAAVLASYLDATVLVADAQRSRRDAVRDARRSLVDGGARLLGAVLNGHPGRSRWRHLVDLRRRRSDEVPSDETAKAARGTESCPGTSAP